MVIFKTDYKLEEPLRQDEFCFVQDVCYSGLKRKEKKKKWK